MKEVTFRKWHCYVGVTLMPLIVVQTISGFVLSIVDSFGFVERTRQGSPEGIAILVLRKLPKFLGSYDDLMMTLHFAGGRLFAVSIELLPR
jgi:Ni/Fe-hydrogenase subunit HybB-like protein